MLSSRWFSEKLAPDGSLEDGVHPIEALALKEYLQGRTTALEAAHAITRPVASASNPNEQLARLWAFLAEALVELSEHTDSVVQLLAAIEELPPPDLSAVEAARQPAHGTLWRCLPGFGHSFADQYQGDWRLNEISNMNEQARAAIWDEQIHIGRAEAKLAVADVGDIPVEWGYERVVDTLEREYKQSEEQVLELKIAAASQWLIIGRGKFCEDAEVKRENWALNNSQLWKHSKNMSWDRWYFWKSRLETLATRLPGVREVAEQVLASMQGNPSVVQV